MAILRKWQIWKNLFNVWKKLEQDDKRDMSIIVGFTKMTYFAKPANLARIETMRQKNSHIDNWRFSQKWQIWENGELSKNHPRSGKTSNEVTKRGRLTKGKFRQIMVSVPKIHQGFGQIFKWDDKKGHVDSWRFLGQWQILRRWRIWQEVIKGLTKIYKEMTKRGILTNGDYNKHGKLGNNSFKVCQNSNEMTNEACR